MRTVHLGLLWLIALPLFAWGGAQPAFRAPPGYPLGNVVGISILALFEILYLYLILRLRLAWLRRLLLMVFVWWGMMGLAIALVITDLGGLPLAHSLWALSSALIVLWILLDQRWKRLRASRGAE